MQHAALDRSALDVIFSRASHWPTDGDWNRVVWTTVEHLIEHPKTGLLMVLVPEGKFITDTDGRAPCEVDLPGYYIGLHPVTNAQYISFVAETGHRPPDNLFWQEAEKMHHPVVCVDWDDATAYCHWAGLRLPNELEWEKASRGLDGRAYPWGKEWDPNRCRNYRNKGNETTAGIWRYGRGGSPFGGLQLSGNVWEWCAPHAVRGGSWCSDGSHFFSTNRRRRAPGGGDDYFGFRCVSGLAASP